MPFREGNRHLTLTILVMVVSLMLIFGAAQLWASEREEDERAAYLAEQAENAKEREQADREYADCLTRFASDLVATIEKRSTATARLERAQRLKDEASDKVFLIVTLARREPPEATERQFDRALDAQVEAQRNYDEVRENVEQVRESNPYTAPKAACTR